MTAKGIKIINSGSLYRVLVKNAIRVKAYRKKIELKASNFLDLKIVTAIPAMPKGRISQRLKKGSLKNLTKLPTKPIW